MKRQECRRSDIRKMSSRFAPASPGHPRVLLFGYLFERLDGSRAPELEAARFCCGWSE